MASENREMIDNYVNPDSLIGDFEWLVTISDDEREIAAGAIVQERARFVVDAVTQNLSRRREELLRQRSEHVVEVEQIDASLADIDGALGSKKEPSLEGTKSTPLLDEYISWLGFKGQYDKFLETLLGRPPMTLWLSKTQNGAHPYTLTSWIRKNDAELKEKFGSHYPNISRTSHIFMMARLHEWPAFKAVDKIVTKYDGEEIGLVIENPYMFINECLNLQGFGINSAITVMCIAEMQRPEYQLSQ